MAAVHVVADPLAAINPTLEVALDWDATLRLPAITAGRWAWLWPRRWTPRSGGWASTGRTAKELIRRSVAEAKTVPGAVLASGAGTDHLEPGPRVTLADVEAAYEEQCAWIEGCGGRIILMASRALAACAKGPDDYAEGLRPHPRQAREPVIVHWLGEMFDPALAGYWGSPDRDRARSRPCWPSCSEYAAKIDGVKISLLDQAREIAMRRRFPPGVRMYTGDDFDYPTTIRGDAQGYSDALLGIFDVIAPAAAAALQALDRGRPRELRGILAPTLHALASPLRRPHALLQDRRGLRGLPQRPPVALPHGGGPGERALGRAPRASSSARWTRAGLLRDPELAAARMRRVLAVAGIE